MSGAPAEDSEHMAEALALALRGRGRVEPNPRVGAIALARGAVVGRGWHRAWGDPHAEVEALAEARAAGARPDTLVVTLEPCSTPAGVAGKKTPPCTQAVLDAGVRRVVVGALDPDPRHHGRGIAVLRDAGVTVTTGVLAEEWAAANRPFARWLALERPWTIAKWAMTLDGKTATAAGHSRWISGEAARAETHALRARVDAIVIGFRTAVRDDPRLDVRHGQALAGAPPPLRVVVDPLAALPLESRLLTTAREQPSCLLVHEAADERSIAARVALGAWVVRVPALPGGGERQLDLAAAWRGLRERGVRRVLVEGGGSLLAQLLDAGCVDQCLVFVAPKLFGGAGAPTPLGGEGVPSPAQALQLDEFECRPCGADVAISGFVR